MRAIHFLVVTTLATFWTGIAVAAVLFFHAPGWLIPVTFCTAEVGGVFAIAMCCVAGRE